MSTNINVNIKTNGLSLLASSQIAVNRQRQLDKEEAKKIEAEGLRLKRKQKVAKKKILSESKSELNQLAATTKVISNIGHFWVSRKSEPVTNKGVWAGLYKVSGNRAYADVDVLIGFKRTTRIYCGNGSSYVEILHGIPDPNRQMIPKYEGFPPVTEPRSTTKACLYPSIPWQTSALADNGYFSDVQIFAFPAGDDRTIIFFLENYSTYTINANVPITGVTRYDYPDEGDISAACGPPEAGPSYPMVPGNPFALYAEILSFDIEVQYKVIQKCFICSNTSIRQISIPTKIQPVLSYIQPKVEFETQIVETSIYTGSSFITQRIAKPQLPVFTFNAVPSIDSYGDIFAPSFYSSTVTPYIYSIMIQPGRFSGGPEDISSYWQDLIGPFVNGPSKWTRAIIEDLSDGLYSTVDGISAVASFNSNEPFFYGRWLEPGIEPTYTMLAIPGLDIEIPVCSPAEYEHDISKPFRMSINRPVIEEESIGYDFYLVKIWDWDRPGYCYTICRELGFADIDLFP